jgi:hypothetical protein
MPAAGNLSLTICTDSSNPVADLHPFATSSPEIAGLKLREGMPSVRAMREEVGAESIPNAPGWSRIVFIAAVCALGGIGFLGATIFMNGRALSFYTRLPVAAPAEAPVQPAQEVVSQIAPRPKPAANDRFQAIEFAPRGEINKATLARCRSHVEAGRAFESLSLKRIGAIREAKNNGDPEAICLDYLGAEAPQGLAPDQLRR